MTYSPQTLQQLGVYWTAHGGRNLGIVGDTAHQAKGTSYHLGEDNLIATAYSRKTARDKAGLTNAASAIDLGKLNGTYTELRKFSNWLYGQARKNAPGTSDFREIIWTPDGKTVMRWDRERGYTSGAKPGEADNSHLYHTHVSWYRDAEQRDHIVAFRPYFEETAMPGITFRFLDRVSGIATVAGANHSLIRTDTGTYAPVPDGQKREVAGRITLTQALGSWPIGTEGYLVGNIPGTTPDQSVAAMLLKKDCTFAPGPDTALAGRRAEWDRQSIEAKVALASRP